MNRHSIAPLALFLLMSHAAKAADMFVMRQAQGPTDMTVSDVMIDRERVSLVQIERSQEGYGVQISMAIADMAGEPIIEIVCADIGTARQVMEALRPGHSETSLDLTGRCEF
jgi:hypothetical protein